ncbi:SMI1/KNR4 family protein [Streptomyces sp. NPDC086783]|uniref:SMI1/KNR4 family protein n=1 Tax=Streptomyces sp. NPDC086783 TaxID=3365758 RepID=UPI00381BC172
MTDEFEDRHGFPPGANEVRLAGHADQAAARTLAQAGIAPPDMVTFYDTIGDVTWADVGNGYFVDPAGDVLLRFKQHGVVHVSAERKAGGLVIGSNGGGLSYVASPGGAIYRTRTASLDEPDHERVADDLRQFLELLERSLTRFVANGDPGCL